MKENKFIFAPRFEITFVSDDFEDGSEYVTYANCGYELFNILKLFYEGKYEEIFSRSVFHVDILSIKYVFINNDIEFSLNIGTDDCAQAELLFKNQLLLDENAKKIAMIREVLDFDKEAEYSLLRDLFNN